MSLLHRLLPSSSPTSSSSIPLLPLTPSAKDRPIPRGKGHTRRSLLLAIAVPLSLFLLLTLFFSPPTPPSRLGNAFEREWRYRNGSNVDVFERLWIYEPGGGKGKASFIALGASLVDFYVPDRNGDLRDISLGCACCSSAFPALLFADKQYALDPSYPYFGAIVGRYANRIANASFTLPSASNQRINLPANEHDGRNTLHGGQWGYSRSGWRVKEHLDSSIAFELLDEEGTEGFPATVLTTATYTLLSSPLRLTTSLSARVLPSPSPSSSSPPVTPILLSSHLYFNLDGYFSYSGSGGDGTGGSAKGHRLWVDADRFVETDGDLIPTGSLPSISPFSALDFRSSGEKGVVIGEKLARQEEVEGLCGSGCSGIDNALVFSPSPSSSSSSTSSKYRNDSSSPVLILSSPEGSGIRMTLRTNQPAVHLYTCNGFSSSSSASSPSGSSARYRRKASHFHRHPEEGEEEEQLYYPHQSCLAIEPEGLIDAVHHWREEDEWGYDPFYTPEREYEWWTEYAFDVV